MGQDHTRADYLFAPIPEALLYDHDMTDAAVRVYGALLRHGLDPESCYPSQKRLGQLVGKAARSIARPLRELEDAGWISRTERFDESGRRSSDGYAVHAEPAQENAPPAHTNGVPPRGNAGGTPAPEREEREQENESQKNEGETLQLVAQEHAQQNRTIAAFDAFWNVYPRHVGKKAAKAAFARAIHRASDVGGADLVIAGAESYRDDPNREDQFTAHPTTWLNRDGWDDDPLPARGRAAPARRPISTDRTGTSRRAAL